MHECTCTCTCVPPEFHSFGICEHSLLIYGWPNEATDSLDPSNRNLRQSLSLSSSVIARTDNTSANNSRFLRDVGSCNKASVWLKMTGYDSQIIQWLRMNSMTRNDSMNYTILTMTHNDYILLTMTRYDSQWLQWLMNYTMINYDSLWLDMTRNDSINYTMINYDSQWLDMTHDD